MTHGDAMTFQVQPQTQSHTERQPDQAVSMVYTITARQTLQTPETAPHATLEQNAERECFAAIARPTTTTQKHVGNNITTSQALPIAK